MKLQESQKLHHRIIQKQMNKFLEKKYISQELKQKIIDNLRYKEDQYNNNII